jgi:hypothetical protein
VGSICVFLLLITYDVQIVTCDGGMVPSSLA